MTNILLTCYEKDWTMLKSINSRAVYQIPMEINIIDILNSKNSIKWHELESNETFGYVEDVNIIPIIESLNSIPPGKPLFLSVFRVVVIRI